MIPSPAPAPVIVVGAGPVGMVAALLLADEDVPTVLLERTEQPHDLPRAAHLDDEALRVLQRLGVLDAMAPYLTPASAYEILHADRALLARIDRSGTPLGHPRSVLMHQPGVDAVLRAAVAAHPLIDLRLGWEVTAVGPDGAPTVTARHATRGTEILAGPGVLACDGASSTVRRLLGVGVRDRGFAQRWLVLDVLLERRPRRLALPQQHCDPVRPTTSVPVGPGRHRVEVLLRPDEDDASALDPRSIGGHLVRVLGTAPSTVERAAVYTFNALDAVRWRVGDTYLLGDAAHQMPPFLGQGLCSGIRDAANLTWKLALVRRGLASDALLGTYERERAAHVAAAIRLSTVLGRVVTGGGPGWTALRHGTGRLLRRSATLRRRIEELGPPPLPSGPITVGVRPGRPVGRPLPQPALDDGSGPASADALLGRGFALLGLAEDPLEDVHPATAAIWAALGARRVGVLPPGTPWPVNPPPDLRWVADPSGTLTAWFAAAGARRAVVRPDRVVLGIAADGLALDRLTAPLARLLG